MFNLKIMGSEFSVGFYMNEWITGWGGVGAERGSWRGIFQGFIDGVEFHRLII